MANLRTFVLALLIASLLALPAVAVAQTATDDVYDPVDAKTHVSTTTHDSSGGLAFTGLDVGLVVLAGTAILGAGVALRRASRTD